MNTDIFMVYSVESAQFLNAEQFMIGHDGTLYRKLGKIVFAPVENRDAYLVFVKTENLFSVGNYRRNDGTENAERR